MFIGHDLGTSSDKAVLIDVEGTVLASASASYPLDRADADRAEQNAQHFWDAAVETHRELMKQSGARPESISALCFAGQMLALVPMDAKGQPTRPAISWLDARAGDEARKLARRFGGERVVMALAGGKPTAKDLLPKIDWIRRREADVYARTRAFGDVTSYMVARATGRLALDPTAAGGTGVFDAERRRWSRWLARFAGVDLGKLPRVHECASIIGGLTDAAAKELSLLPGTRVVMGMADIPAAAVGAGALRENDVHLYLGTSAWIGMTTASPSHHARMGIAAVPGAAVGTCLSIGEMETAGACREWARRWLELSEAGFDAQVQLSAPGARGLLFAPHLFGERAPFPDAQLRGAFVGLGLDHGRPEFARAVLEGVALNLRHVLDAMSVDSGATLRVVGGGARSDAWLTILADVTGRRLERVARPELAGAVGVALTAAVGVGALRDFAAIPRRIEVDCSFTPNVAHRETYARRLRELDAMRPALAAHARRT